MISPDQFQNESLAWLKALTVVCGALGSALAPIVWFVWKNRNLIKLLVSAVESHARALRGIQDHPAVSIPALPLSQRVELAPVTSPQPKIP